MKKIFLHLVDAVKKKEKEKFQNSTHKFLYYTWNTFLFSALISYGFVNGVIFEKAFLLLYVFLSLLIVTTIIILFRKEFGFERLAALFIAGLFTGFMFLGFRDIPAYLQGEYKKVEGVPEDFHRSGGGKGGSSLWVTIEGVELDLPSKISDQSADRWFVVEYLPHSRFVMSYEILSKKQTAEKLLGDDRLD